MPVSLSSYDTMMPIDYMRNTPTFDHVYRRIFFTSKLFDAFIEYLVLM